jgi:exosome complex component MTR3
VFPRLPTLKLSCSIHGPRPLPRSTPFSPHLQLNVHVKYTPYAARTRKGYVRDPVERDLSASLETTLRGVVIGERYPKTGVDVCITVLEAEEDTWGLGEGDSEGAGTGNARNWGTSSVLAGCISVAGAALMDAGIDCVDMITGGTAAVVLDNSGGLEIVLDPNPVEHSRILASCVVGYLSTRDEMTLLWTRGSVSGQLNTKLVDAAVSSALGVRGVVESAVRDGALRKMQEIAGT